MKLRRIANPRGWTSIPNAALEDTDLSWRATGILGYLLSRPPGWETDSIRLASSRPGKEGRDAVRTALTEIEAAGYLHRVKVRARGGQVTTEWFVSDHPLEHPSEVLELGDGLYADDPLGGTGAWESGAGSHTVDNPVEELGISTPPAPGQPTPENPAPLTRNINNLESSPGDHRGLAALAVEKDGASGPDLPATDALALASRLEARVQMFALRAHLVEVLGYQPPLSEVAGYVDLAHHAAPEPQRGHLSTADVLAHVQALVSPPEPESSALTGAAPSGGLSAAVPAPPAGIDDASPIPSSTSRPVKDT